MRYKYKVLVGNKIICEATSLADLKILMKKNNRFTDEFDFTKSEVEYAFSHFDKSETWVSLGNCQNGDGQIIAEREV